MDQGVGGKVAWGVDVWILSPTTSRPKISNKEHILMNIIYLSHLLIYNSPMRKKQIVNESLSDGKMVDRITYSRLNAEGMLETIDQFTDEVIKIEPYVFVKKESRRFNYSDSYKDMICDLVLQGHTIESISKIEGMPSVGVIYKWRDEHEDFKVALSSARTRRGDYYFDKIAERTKKLAESSCIDKDDIPGEKHIVDTYKWMAQVDNPEQYGNKTKVVGDADAPLVIQVVTGINRDDDVEKDCELPVIETTAKIVEEQTIGDSDGKEK